MRLVAAATELLVAVEGATSEITTRYREVIDSHLKRFAFREGFEAMDWADTKEAPTWPADLPAPSAPAP